MATVLPAALLACRLISGEAALSDGDLQRAETHRQRAALKLAQGQLAMAIREYQHSISLNPYSAESHFGLGESLRIKGKPDEAEAEFLRSLELDPELQDARLNLSGLYLSQGRWEDAIRETTRLVEDPTFLNPARALVNRGWAYYSSHDLARAETDFREALSQNGSLYQASLNLGILLYERGETLDAIKQFERALFILDGFGKRAPASPEAEVCFRLGQAHVKLGQRDKAVARLRRAASRKQATVWASRAEEYLELLE